MFCFWPKYDKNNITGWAKAHSKAANEWKSSIRLQRLKRNLHVALKLTWVKFTKLKWASFYLRLASTKIIYFLSFQQNKKKTDSRWVFLLFDSHVHYTYFTARFFNCWNFINRIWHYINYTCMLDKETICSKFLQLREVITNLCQCITCDTCSYL